MNDPDSGLTVRRLIPQSQAQLFTSQLQPRLLSALAGQVTDATLAAAQQGVENHLGIIHAAATTSPR